MTMNRNFRFLGVLAIAMALPFCALAASKATASPQAPPQQPTPIMPLEDVRVGMTGYGLSVFHGTAIEPFAVEVVSVMQGFAPQRAVVWIRCPDERMQKSGPVSGMSGSPIYLWREGEPQVPGQGGGLIGAFAFGFQTGKDCYVGVQPIEGMRLAGQRALQAQPVVAGAASTAVGLRSLQQLLDLATRQHLSSPSTWRLRALLKVLAAGRQAATEDAPSRLNAAPSPFGSDSVAPLALPLAVPSAASAQLLEPFLRDSGIKPMWGGGIAGAPPPGIDLQAIRLQPGAVLGVPLLWGDMDLSASGTVTDVLPNGQVLGFGHALLGQGPLCLPMSSGYVHYVFPSIVQSFKLVGSGTMQGSLVGDEQLAVIGSPEARFESAKVAVHVRQPGQPDRTYHYEIARHPQLTGPIAALAALESLRAVQDLPRENTLELSVRMRLDGERDLALHAFVPQATAMDAPLLVLPALQMLANNDYQRLLLTDMQMDLTVQPTTQELSIVRAAAGRLQVRPGETVELALEVQPRGQPAYEQRLRFAVPDNLPDGDYELQVTGVEGYVNRLQAAKPHLFETQRLEDLLEILRLLGSMDERAFYLTMQLPERKGVAVGRQELADLPGSRQALLTSQPGSGISDFSALLEKRVPCERAVQGAATFTVTVRRELKVD